MSAAAKNPLLCPETWQPCTRGALCSTVCHVRMTQAAPQLRTARTAWLRTENGVAIICAWCPDKELADSRATAGGLQLSHGICDECARREGFLPAGVVSFFQKNFAGETREISAGNAGETKEGYMANHTTGFDLFTCPTTGRRYVAIADIAIITGLTPHTLDTRHRPDDWASPRDFRFEGGRLWFALLALPQFADALQANGEIDAALKLRERVTPLVAAEAIAVAGAAVREDLHRACATSHRPLSGADAQARWEADHS